MATIEVDFQVFKAITTLRESERVTPNDVLRKLLKLPEAQSPRKIAEVSPREKGMFTKGLFLPDGTRLEKVYKGKQIVAEVRDNRIHVVGIQKAFTSPSAAAVAITIQPTNGWIFWNARFPDGTQANPLAKLRK